ncbi:hypothetical protein LCGC14_0194450 [marine sediment metagenome]|uniref:Uncharacterized protein n=1 Tax=marine sediment metagenome TaxID=412755 RepID=A0A0F9XN60_9ZZZZ
METFTTFFNEPIGIAVAISAIIFAIAMAVVGGGKNKRSKKNNFGKNLVITTGFVGAGIIGFVFIIAIWAALAGGTVVIGTWIAFGEEPSTTWQWILVLLSAVTLLLQLIFLLIAANN